MLKPSKDDPNYEAEMERHKQDPSSWGPGAPSPAPIPASTDQGKSEQPESGEGGTDKKAKK